MKVILSRKGFDSSAGGHASPILPDGTMLSLPIPSSHDSLSYDAIRSANGRSLAKVLSDLGGKTRIAGNGAHLDPDLRAEARPRLPGWRPSLGQIGAAAGHLRNQGVGPGDLFLFYGWFRPTELVAGQLRFSAPGDGFHAIYGYMQVDEVIRTAEGDPVPDWLADHPHCSAGRVSKMNNAIYVSRASLDWEAKMSGAGTFKFSPGLTLSKPGMSRSCWALDPSIFRGVTISYHSEEAWRDGFFKSYPRAQEYVIAADERVEAWARLLVSGLIKQQLSGSELCES